MFKTVLTAIIFAGSLGLAHEHKEEMKEAISELHQACAEDIKTLCADVKPGGKRIMKCLKQNKDKVSEGCKATFKEKRKEMKEMHKEMKEKNKEEKHDH